MNGSDNQPLVRPDVVLIGAGIMSATLAVLLKELQPEMEVILLTANEVAARLGVGRMCVYRLMDEGKLGWTHVGRYRKVSMAALEAYIKKNTFDATK